MAGFLGNQPSQVPLTSADIADGTITNDDLAGSITDSKISALSASKLTGALPAISGASLTSLPSDITKSTSEPTATTNPSGGVGTLWLRTTTGEMYCLTDSTTNANVWTNIGDGTGDMPYIGMVATGGTITTDGDYKVHVFNSSGTFEITTLGHDAVLDYLVIAGGGGGAGNSGGGGGGAGGYRTATGFSVSATSYSITVGGGGANHGTSVGASGSDSVFSSITSIGGGGAGHQSATTGSSGGSGGGGASASGAGGAGTSGQGNNGGAGGSNYYGGGGGGAGSAGTTGTSSVTADGGDGLSSSITGSAIFRGGGGGGHRNTASAISPGGQGGGGDGGYAAPHTPGTSGTVNTGGGAGGHHTSAGASLPNGGSGVVILRYKFQ